MLQQLRCLSNSKCAVEEAVCCYTNVTCHVSLMFPNGQGLCWGLRDPERGSGAQGVQILGVGKSPQQARPWVPHVGCHLGLRRGLTVPPEDRDQIRNVSALSSGSLE